MQELVFVKKNKPFTDSMTIAEAVDLQHKSVARLINSKKKYLEAFGPVEFSDLKSLNSSNNYRGRPTKVYDLNEEQATLLITFLDNNEKVDIFKTELVKQFFLMKDVLQQKQTKLWEESRGLGIEQRKAETDVIAEFIEYAKEQGSGHADKYYMHFSNLANKVCGIKNRNFATVFQLNNLTLVERAIMITIRNGLLAEIPYKDIYQNCKKQVELFSDVAYLEVI